MKLHGYLRHSASESVLVLVNLSTESKLLSVADDLKANGYNASQI